MGSWSHVPGSWLEQAAVHPNFDRRASLHVKDTAHPQVINPIRCWSLSSRKPLRQVLASQPWYYRSRQAFSALSVGGSRIHCAWGVVWNLCGSEDIHTPENGQVKVPQLSDIGGTMQNAGAFS